MKTNINDETMKHLEIIFSDAAELGKYKFDEFDKFLNEVLIHGMVMMEKIVSGQIDEDDLSDIDEMIVLTREKMFSEN